MLAFLFTSQTAVAWEAIEARPGTRAVGMAGVFSAQADDSSALWYNPAGPRHREAINIDVSLDWGQIPVGALSRTSESVGYAETTTTKFAGFYHAGLPLIRESASWGVGIAYFRPYETQVYVDAPRSLVDSAPFGRINVALHQASAGISRIISPELTVGGTVDFLWNETDCLEFSPCVDNGPSGWGSQIGVLYDLLQHKGSMLTLGAMWRSKASLTYDSTPRSGLGTVLESYLPGRPTATSMALSIQSPTRWALVKANMELEKKSWSGASASNESRANYVTVGASGEGIFVIGDGQTLALRMGRRNAQTNDGASGNVNIAAAGLGYGFSQRHIVDLACERRNNERQGKATLCSVSYSLQY